LSGIIAPSDRPGLQIAAGVLHQHALEQVEVGLDDDGDPIISCVIVEADTLKSGSGRTRVSEATKQALTLLERAIADTETTAPASNHIPPNIRTTTLVRWRSYCDSGMVATSGKPDSRRRAFVRACERLQTLGVIGIWQEHVWLAGHAGQ